MISVVIPSRQEQFLSKTVEDILKNSRGEIEVIAVLDGGQQDLPTDPRVKSIIHGSPRGMRASINEGVAISKGELIMKLDGHCMLDEGFDVKLAENIEKNWVVIPRRKRLDAENWCIQDVGKPDVDYEFLSYPSDPNDFGGPGLNGKIWTQRALERKDIEIDENMSAQGSCWFMHKDYFYELELMDDKNYGTFWNEAQEILLKAWLSGGKAMTNKKTWYAHLHKGKKYGRGYSLDHSQLTIGATHTKKWFHFKKAWDKQIYPLEWLIERFWPVPTWPDDRRLWIPNPDILKPSEHSLSTSTQE
jgi:glycosyltransferase involved in cell wall biosynthesis